MKNLSISLLNCNDIFSFLDKLKKYETEHIKKKQINISIHFDVMDNVFVPNKGIDILKIEDVIKYGFCVQTHLMCDYPLKEGYIDKAYLQGSKDITIHFESKEFKEALNYLLKLKKRDDNLKIGISIKPETSVKVLDKYIDVIDKVLIMSVEPGFGKQKYLDIANEKIKYLKEKYNDKIIVQVDGGVNENTISTPVELNCDSFVVGSYLTLNEDELFDRIDKLTIITQIHSAPREFNLFFQSRTLQIVPGGYGQGDILLGIKVPRLRKIEKVWYNISSVNIIKWLLTSPIHEYRAIAVYSLADLSNKDNYKEIKKIIDENINYINNWDLTDSLAPKAIGKQLMEEDDTYVYKTLSEYTKSKNIWKRRIGIVSLLPFAKDNRKDVVLRVIDDVFYDEFNLTQKANGWVLRELYKSNPNDTLNYLIEKNRSKKIPSILKSYAMEKMTKEEKEKLM